MFFKKSNKYFISGFLIKYLWISRILPTSILQKSTEKPYTYLFSPVYFIILTEKSFEIFPKNSKYITKSESFALNW